MNKILHIQYLLFIPLLLIDIINKGIYFIKNIYKYKFFSMESIELKSLAAICGFT